MRAATADTHQWSMFSLVSQLPVGKRAPAYARYGTFFSLRCCLSRSLRLPPPFLRLPPRSLPFISPILDKKAKAHIAREQLVSAISNHQRTSQSPLIFAAYLPSFPGVELTQNRFGRSPGTPTLKAPRSLFYILSLVLHPLSHPSARSLSHISFSPVLFLISLNPSFPFSSPASLWIPSLHWQRLHFTVWLSD